MAEKWVKKGLKSEIFKFYCIQSCLYGWFRNFELTRNGHHEMNIKKIIKIKEDQEGHEDQEDQEDHED